MKKNNFCIVVCEESGFMLPALESAFDCIEGNLKSIRKCYMNSIIFFESGDVTRVVDILDAGNKSKGIFGFLSKKTRILFKCEPVDLSINDILKKISMVATGNKGYSVWGQFYDSKSELNEALMKCTDFNSVSNALGITRTVFSEKIL